MKAGGLGSMSIAVDDAGVPHILHLPGNPSDEVRYLTRERGGWTGEVELAMEQASKVVAHFEPTAP